MDPSADETSHAKRFDRQEDDYERWALGGNAENN